MNGRPRTRQLATLAISVAGLLCALTSISASQDKLSRDGNTATVRIVVLSDKPMNFITGLRVLRFQADGRLNLADRFENGFRKDKATGIPYGTYHAQIYLDGFWGAAEQTVQVSQPDVAVVIEARPKPPRGDPFER